MNNETHNAYEVTLDGRTSRATVKKENAADYERRMKANGAKFLRVPVEMPAELAAFLRK